MKRKYSYIYLLLGVILLNIPLSVNNFPAWEDTLKELCIISLDSAMPVHDGKPDIPEIIGMKIFSPVISVLEYRQDDGLSAENPLPEDIFPEADGNTDITDYRDLSKINSSDLHSGNPKVLIYHTHTTESYLTKEGEKPSSWRSTDKNKNLLSVGSIVSKVLHDEYGIEVLHITEILDKPYDLAYDKSYEIAKAAVEKYPSIEYIFDIHRDGLSDNSANRQVYLTEINGQKCASIMFVMSTKSKYISEMRSFGSAIQKKMNSLYPGLFRKNMDRPYKYNLEFRPNSMLFEVGSNLTTIAEAKAAAVYLGRSLGEVITQYSGE